MRKLNATVVLGLVVALMGAGLVFVYGRGVDQRVARGQATVPVLVTTRAVPAGTPASSLGDAVALRQIPRAYVATSVALGDLAPVMALALKTDLAPGVQVTSTDFGPPTAPASLQTAAGNIAIAVSLDVTPGVARYVGPDSYVDVFATYPGGSGDSGGNAQATPRTKLFASGVHVLKVTVAPPADTQKSGEAAPEQAAPGGGVVAVLDVSPALAEKIVNVATLGKLYMALSGKDQQHTTPSGASSTDVLGSNT